MACVGLIRACYGKCGFASFLIDASHVITRVIEIEDESNIVCDER